MSLIEIEYGSLASSADVNNNFQYLDNKVSGLSDLITTKTASFASNVATLNTNVTSVMNCKDSFLQPGMIIGTFAAVVPKGFLLCDGSEVNVADYPDLYEVIGTTFGSSDSTKFCLPNLCDKTLWGSGSSDVCAELKSKLPNITGQFRLAGTEGSSSVSGAFSAGTKGGSWGTGHDTGASNPLMKFDASKSSQVYSDDVSIVQPPAIVVNFIIKY